MKRTDHDGLFKELLQTFFVEFVAAFLPNMAQYLEPDSIEFLDKEIIREVAARRKHTVDILVKARFRGEETFFLVHVENQSKTEADFPERMFDYFSWLRAKYRLPIYPVVIFSFAEPLRPEPNRFKIDFPGETVLNFQYKVIQLNRLPWRRFLKQPNPVATALMTKMKIAPRDRAKVKSECLRLLLTLKLDPARADLIWTFAESYLTLTAQETTQYEREIAKLSLEEQEATMQLMTSMRREGIQEGIQQGVHEGQERIIVRQIKKRFGSVRPEVTQQLSILSADNLDNLGEAMFDFSTQAELEAWISRRRPK
jgi:hypothetical protein